jgi:hypothetical protein
MSRTVKQAYRKSRRFDKTCRNHGSCDYCKGNRLYSSNKRNIESLHGLKSLQNG